MTLEVLAERETLLEVGGHRLSVRSVRTRRGRYRSRAVCSCGDAGGLATSPTGPVEWFLKHRATLDSADERIVSSPRRRRTEAVP